MATGIASKWKVLSGENNWESLLDVDPIDKDFLSYLIHYGKMVGAIGDALDTRKESESYGLSRYLPPDLFSKVGLEKGNPFEYRVTKYFYIKSKFHLLGKTFSESSAWIGYVAVSTEKGKEELGRRDILVCWRGTNGTTEWLNDFKICKTSSEQILGKANSPEMHSGFYSSYVAKDPKCRYTKFSAKDQVVAEINRLVKKYANEEVSITVAGHSLGAALATLNATDIVANGHNKASESHSGFPVTVFAYASPRVGDKGFQTVFNDLSKRLFNPSTSVNPSINFSNLRLLRIKNAYDPVPKLPVTGYRHVGMKLKINSSKSQYLQETKVVYAHNLDMYLHGIAGYHGTKGKFKLVNDLVSPYDIALVNKHKDALKREYGIPSSWWASRDNIIKQMDDGSWKPTKKRKRSPEVAEGSLFSIY